MQDGSIVQNMFVTASSFVKVVCWQFKSNFVLQIVTALYCGRGDDWKVLCPSHLPISEEVIKKGAVAA